jgi:hypothetical protein
MAKDQIAHKAEFMQRVQPCELLSNGKQMVRGSLMHSHGAQNCRLRDYVSTHLLSNAFDSPWNLRNVE